MALTLRFARVVAKLPRLRCQRQFAGSIPYCIPWLYLRAYHRMPFSQVSLNPFHYGSKKFYKIDFKFTIVITVILVSVVSLQRFAMETECFYFMFLYKRLFSGTRSKQSVLRQSFVWLNRMIFIPRILLESEIELMIYYLLAIILSSSCRQQLQWKHFFSFQIEI